MKKIMLALTLLVAAVVTFAFTGPVKHEKDTEAVYNVIYRFDGLQTQADYEDESKWVQVPSAASIGCEGTGAVCWISFTDDSESDNPPTLPDEFDPFSVLHGEKGQ